MERGDPSISLLPSRTAARHSSRRRGSPAETAYSASVRSALGRQKARMWPSAAISVKASPVRSRRAQVGPGGGGGARPGRGAGGRGGDGGGGSTAAVSAGRRGTPPRGAMGRGEPNALLN